MQDAKTWINNRVVYYSSETGNYLYWMNKPSNKVKGEHGFWMVRILDKYWALTRNKIPYFLGTKYTCFVRLFIFGKNDMSIT